MSDGQWFCSIYSSCEKAQWPYENETHRVQRLENTNYGFIIGKSVRQLCVQKILRAPLQRHRADSPRISQTYTQSGGKPAVMMDGMGICRTYRRPRSGLQRCWWCRRSRSRRKRAGEFPHNPSVHVLPLFRSLSRYCKITVHQTSTIRQNLLCQMAGFI